MTSEMRSRRSSFRTGQVRALKGLLATLVLFFLGRFIWTHYSALRVLEVDFRLTPLFLSVLLLATYCGGRVLVWHYLTLKSGVAIPLGHAFAAWSYSQLGKYLPGKVFLLLSRVYLYGRHHRPRSTVTLVFALETTATLSASVFTVLLSLLLLDIPALDRYRIPLAAMLVAFLVVLHPRFLRTVLTSVLRVLRRPPQPLELGYGDTLSFVALYTLNWLVFGLAFYLFSASLFTTPPTLVLYFAGSFSLASLIGMFSVFVPSGLGVREGVLIFMLGQVMPVEAAIIVSIAARIWFTAVELASIAIVYGATRVTVPRRADLSSSSAADGGRPTARPGAQLP